MQMQFRCLLCAITATLFFIADVYAVENSYSSKCKEYGFVNCDDVGEICSQIFSIKIPEQDKPSADERKYLEGCSSEELYFGYGKAAEYTTARKCAYLQIEQNKTDGVVDGKPILMSIYANGEGVKRNLDLALKFACDDDAFAPAEYLGRIMHVNMMRQRNISRQFDYCDDVTSSYMIGFCAGRQAKLDKAKRNIAYQKIIGKWAASERLAFEKMLILWQAYLKARIDEIDQSGMARAVMVVEDQENMEKNFLSDLTDFEKGRLPQFSEQDNVRTDQELNIEYKKIQGIKEEEFYGTVTKENIKLAQRAWLKYRDAWIVFAKQKYPSVAEVSWKAKLTKERVALLQEFIN